MEATCRDEIHEFLSRCDGGGGFTVIETDDAADLIGVTSKFAAFADTRSTLSSR